MLRVYKIVSYIIKLIGYCLMAGIIFGAWPILFGMDSGKVTPEEWARAKVWSVIILLLDFVVFFGLLALDKKMAKRFAGKV